MNGTKSEPSEEAKPEDFIRDIIYDDLETGRYQKVLTRFPPEPNGYLHVGHAKSICLNFGIAREFGGHCNLRMDDTNPTKEETEYVESIQKDVDWLLANWGESVKSPEIHYASNNFDAFYDYAVKLIQDGKAYVCDLDAEKFAQYRGTPTVPGKDSPWRGRSVEENLDLFERMRKGEFPDGSRTLRARIDMASSNIHMRDPALYRIRHADHHRTGSEWPIYPTYDYAHCLTDSIEGISHSICTLEFEVHRPLYDWILDNLPVPQPRPHQYEFAGLKLSYTILSKRRLLQLVQEKHVDGWDDPRLPTISGLRRRGITAGAIRQFCYVIGVTKYNSLTDVALFEHAIRADLNKRALRRLAVLRPLKVVITNYPEDQVELLQAVNNPEDPSSGKRPVPFGQTIYIEQDDFMEEPPAKYFRLKPGGEVRLKYAYIIKCESVVKDEHGNVVELRCSADLDSKTGGATAGRKVKGTIHWVSALHAIDAEVRLYDRLFSEPDPAAQEDFLKSLNPNSLEVVQAKCEPSLGEAGPEHRYQFERIGYFCMDPESATARSKVFNRTITLRDNWLKQLNKR